MKSIYMDYAATTPTDPAVVEAMLPYFTEVCGNPSSLHAPALEAREAVDQARATIAVSRGQPRGNCVHQRGHGE